MCGIWASIGFEAPRDAIRCVAHRGPDAEGWQRLTVKGVPIWLGHRRLSILGLGERGDQPMRLKERACWIVFNGEIYNYRELRTELEALGAAFVTDTDTEVILHAYSRWRENCLDRLEGMFAFVIVDEEMGTALAARDRFGIKPLYYTVEDGRIAFASEIKQHLVASPHLRKVNMERAADFLVGGLTDHSGETMVTGVHQLRGGERMHVRLDGRDSSQIATWYTLPDPDSLQLSPCEASGKLRLHLEAAVRRHLVSDVPGGISLSGGLDSSTIAALARQVGAASDAPWRGVTAAFEGSQVDETRQVRRFQESTGLPVTWTYPDWSEIPEIMGRLAWHMDEPFCGTSALAQWAVYAAAHQEGLKVMLGGQGADELLGGYVHMGAVRRRELDDMIADLTRNTAWSRTLSLKDVAIPQQQRCGSALTSAVRDIWNASTDRDTATLRRLGPHCSYLLTERSLPLLLRYEDRMSMAHSVEARVPFLDRPLVEFCIAMGGRHKIYGDNRKHVLRNAVEDLLPSQILRRTSKLGFSTPESEWLSGPLRIYVGEGAKQTAGEWPSLFDLDGIEDVLARSADEGSFMELWRIHSFGFWSRTFGIGV